MTGTLLGSSCVLLNRWLIRSPKCFLPYFWNVYSASYSTVFTFPAMDGEVLHCVLYCICLTWNPSCSQLLYFDHIKHKSHIQKCLSFFVPFWKIKLYKNFIKAKTIRFEFVNINGVCVCMWVCVRETDRQREGCVSSLSEIN